MSSGPPEMQRPQNVGPVPPWDALAVDTQLMNYYKECEDTPLEGANMFARGEYSNAMNNKSASGKGLLQNELFITYRLVAVPSLRAKPTDFRSALERLTKSEKCKHVKFNTQFSTMDTWFRNVVTQSLKIFYHMRNLRND